jgi:hypothetical protein
MNQLKYNFDRSKPFYPIVISYLIHLHAIKEIAALGALGPIRTWNLDAIEGSSEEKLILQKSINSLLGPISLGVTDDQNRVEISVYDLAKEFVNNHAYLIGHQVQAALNTLVMAHEVTKGKPYRDTAENWEFLRHCRNAAAHNGRWYFRNGEPRHPAKWRGIELIPKMHDEPLLLREDGTGYLKLGDPIALLWEIERDTSSISF